MQKNKLIEISMLAVALGAVVFVLGCNSSSTGDAPGPDVSGIFVPTDENTGSIGLNVLQRRMGVGDSSGFLVTVKDAAGSPVPDMQVSCDTELGLALIEPTTGTEMTDGRGTMSGRVGCTAPGSFRMGCRLPLGANRRQFETIVCSGSAPVDFAGFPGAGGGGLGGGVDNTDSQGGAGAIRVTEVSFDDMDDTEIYSIDIGQSRCGTGANAACEPFFDAYVNFSVVNNSRNKVRLTEYDYVIQNADGPGINWRSRRLSFSGPLEVAPGGDAASIRALFLQVTSATVSDGLGECSGRKQVFGRTDYIQEPGFKNITFNLYGTDLGDQSVTVSVSTAASFQNFNNCG